MNNTFKLQFLRLLSQDFLELKQLDFSSFLVGELVGLIVALDKNTLMPSQS